MIPARCSDILSLGCRFWFVLLISCFSASVFFGGFSHFSVFMCCQIMFCLLPVLFCVHRLCVIACFYFLSVWFPAVCPSANQIGFQCVHEGSVVSTSSCALWVSVNYVSQLVCCVVVLFWISSSSLDSFLNKHQVLCYFPATLNMGRFVLFFCDCFLCHPLVVVSLMYVCNTSGHAA